jgi:AIR synthase-related protein
MMLSAIVEMLRNAKGVAHKRDIAPVLARLNLGADTAVAVGDDCAAIPDGDGFLLLAIEGFMPEFLSADPQFAGYCGVMVNLSDIAAMGGRAIAVVDAIWSADATAALPVLSGMKTAAARYQVPIVGGHTNTRAGVNLLSVAILGRARKLLTSFDAKPGENIVAAVDLRGFMRAPAPYWDASTRADPARLRGDLELLAEIAEAGLCAAAKDISMAGIVGTTVMLLEASKLGGVIDIAAIPKPQSVALEHWLTVFPSYGYLLSVAPAQTDVVLARFAARGIDAGVIGKTDDTRLVRLRDGAQECLFWRLADDGLIGCAA